MTGYNATTGHTHTQTSSSTTWTITHNLDTLSPVVDCWIDVSGDYTKILPLTVTATSNLVVTITFSSAQSGSAYVA